MGAQDDHASVARYSSYGFDRFTKRGADIGLVQNYDWLRPTLVRQNKIALKSPQFEIAIQPTDDHRQIEVGGDHLLGHRPARGASRKPCAPRKQGLNQGYSRINMPNRDPITYGWQNVIPPQPAGRHSLTLGTL
jgi:hypothetical protein